MKRWSLIAAAALGVGAAGCDDRSLSGESGPDAGADAAVAHEVDLAIPVVSVEYGPAMMFSDLSEPPDGGTQ